MKKLIFLLFAILIFFVPLILWPFTSEVFEFNKMVFVYILTTLIVGAWLSRCLVERRFIFRRTILDIPLLVFFGSQLISTLLSIDFYTSVFGYYSRFNGGLVSTICYLVLYWAFVSNFDKKDTLNLVKIWFGSAVLVSVYGVLEHFGIDKNLWVQDVKSRVFSTLGQPNWLAAWVVALAPLTWSFALSEKLRAKSFWLYVSLSGLFFWTLIFTKSRSGMLGMAVAFLIFWTGYLWQKRKSIKLFIIPFVVFSSSFLVISLISGTQWTPSIYALLKHQTIQPASQTSDTALETGGTESGVIREIVWKGAIEIWQHYPVFGTGIETFAYSYYLYRPAAHNLTSEWDFIYNKAHNEFLNMAANSGSIGLISYLILIGFSIFLFVQKFELPITNSQFTNNLKIALLAGFLSLSASNFFGFSVVPTQLEFFLFPALAVAGSWQHVESVNRNGTNKLTFGQKFSIGCVLLATSYLLLATWRYWYSDTLYAKAKAENGVGRPDLAYPLLTQAITFEPDQAIYYSELAMSYSTIALAYDQAKEATTTAEFVNLATTTTQKAVQISPANLNLRRQQFGVYVRLSTIDEKYLAQARESLNETIKLAPTDPKLRYNLGIADANLGSTQEALNDFQKAIELKANYLDARIEYAALLVHLKRNDEAKVQLNYILTKIDPNNQTAKTALSNIK